MTSTTIPLGLYLWRRIHQCGVSTIFGVPGDFNLALLDYIYEVDGLDWASSTNELNAAYTADGYARVKGGAGCFVTTHGVGELSALNGVAGAMSEHIKVIHIIGQLSRQMQDNHLMIHHNIGHKPDHRIFERAADLARCSAASLYGDDEAADDIDRVLRACFVESKPVTIHLPMDMVDIAVDASRLSQPLDLAPTVDTTMLGNATKTILEAIYNARSPGILVDYLTKQYNATHELLDLLEHLHLPVFTTPMGKGIVAEDHEGFVGIYNGAVSRPEVTSAFEACDLILVAGDMPSDINTGGHTRKLNPATIYINAHEVITPAQTFSNISIQALLAELAREIDPARVLGIDVPVSQRVPLLAPSKGLITQAWIWPRLADFFRPGDVVVAETGTASFGLAHTTLPAHVQWMSQMYHGSIGYATPATFGAEMALRDITPARNPPRTVLVTGDGSLMLTVQEIGSMIRYGASPVIFIINNAGYTIERAIHGAHKSYNDIVPFNYSCMLQFLGMPAEQARRSFHRAATADELDVVLSKDSVRNPSCVQIVEVIMDKFDIPWSLATQLVMRGPKEVQEMQESGFAV